MEAKSNRHSRRSTTNLHHLSLAPLTSKFPIVDGEDIPQTDGSMQRISYIEGKSAPTTPGILSRSPSSTRTRLKPHSPLPKSQSSSQLQRPKNNSNRLRNKPTDSEWIHRAGAAISSEARESKGQSWLVSRASSTSLVDQDSSNTFNSYDGRESISFADDEFSPYSARASRFNSRAGSRIHSRFASRQGSRVGSRAELGSYSLSRRDSEQDDGVFEDEFIAEPDFVDMDEEAFDAVAADDMEVGRLTKTRGFGLGNWLDGLIGWSLFTADEEVDDDDNDEGVESAQGKEVRSHAGGSEDAPTALAVETSAPEAEEERQENLGENEGGWQDAAWLLSVATKILI